jgi:CheY-like chemotaxis protein
VGVIVLGIFIDDGRLPGLNTASADVRVVDHLCCEETVSLDEWFATRLFEELVHFADGVAESKAEILLCLNANFKFSRAAKRSTRDGLKILEHIRFTRGLPNKIRYAPAVVYSFEPGWGLAASADHPLLLPGTGLVFARLPDHLLSLVSPSYWPQWKEAAGPLDEHVMKKALNPNVRLGGELYAHSYRNLAGAAKFCQEFAGDVLPKNHTILATLEKRERSDRELKRLLATQPGLAPGGPPTQAGRETFSNLCKDLRFLFIDDEHAKGWSLGLYAGITGQSLDQSAYEKLCSETIGSTVDGRMYVASRADRALELFEKLHRDFEENLSKWCKTFEASKQADEEFAKANQESVKADRDCENSRANYRNAEAESLRIETGLKKWLEDLRRLAQDSEEGAVSLFDVNKDESELPKRLLESQTTFFKLSQAIEGYNKAIQDREKIAKRIAESNTNVNATEKAVGRKREELQLVTTKLEAARKSHGQSITELQVSFPFHIVFLDLRIEPEKDALVPTREASGMTLLRFIKKHFPALPVIMMTASEKALSFEQALEAGASGYWIKGVSTGEQLQKLVKRAALQATLIPLWNQMQQVRRRSYLSVKLWNNSSGSFEPARLLDTDKSRRATINNLLEDSLERIWQRAGAGSNASSNLSTEFNRVISNLGIIQEIRFQGVVDNKGNTRPVWSKTTAEEQTFHFLRNAISHEERYKIATREEGEKFLKHTVGQLLL